jgi:PAS domain S-box-containing protein
MVILDGIEDAVVKLDEHANFAAMNQAAADLYQRLGLSFQTMKGKSIWELVPALKGTTVERQLRSVIEDHLQVSFEFYYPQNQRWYEIRGYPAAPGAILIFHDITHKKTPLAPS